MRKQRYLRYRRLITITKEILKLVMIFLTIIITIKNI